MIRILSVSFLLLTLTSLAPKEPKPQVIDEVIAIVGNTPVLRSELDFQVSQVDPDIQVTEEMRCNLLRQILIEKMLVHQAEIDSVLVDDGDVNDKIENNLRFFERQIRTREKMEQFLGMSIAEYKKMIFPKVKNQMLKEKMQAQLLTNIKISPKEVREFYHAIPKDSLPFMPAEVELAQIAFQAEYSKEAKEAAKFIISELRERIMNGESFANLALYYSEDPGSKVNGGMLPEFGRGDMVSEFERAAYLTKKDSVSEVIETAFGYHVVKVIDKRGDRVIVRHILIRPKLMDADYKLTKQLADSVLTLLRGGKLEFCKAVALYSDDEETKPNCGFFTDPNIGSQRIPFDYLEQDMAAVVSKMSPGEYTEPEIGYMQDGTPYYRIFYLKLETKPHVANLEQDWQRLQNMAIEKKKITVLEDWTTKKRKETYIYISSSYLSCGYFDDWLTKN